jgi:hypothetical protein
MNVNLGRGRTLVANPLIWLSGAQPEILAEFKHDQPKYVGIGSAVLITSTMAAVSMTFALHIALDASVVVAIPFALAWGLAIMSLDRWLVVSMTRKQLLLAIPRALLGLLFGIIISTPLTLQIFHVEIANQISVDHTNATAAYNTSPAVAKLTAAITADQQAVAKYQSVIDSGGGTGTSPSQDPTLIGLNKQLTTDQSDAQSYYKAWHCEEYGGCGPTYVVGNGKAAQTDYSEYEYYTGQVQSTELQIAAAQKSLNATNASNAGSSVRSARTDLSAAQVKLNRDQSTLTALKENYEGTLGKDTGILASLQALDQLRMSSPTVFVAELLLFLFFTAIEWLPIGVKVLLNLGPENSYEKALAESEEVSLMRAENERMTQYLRSVREQSELHQESDQIYSKWLNDVLPQLVRDELTARERVARYRMAQWEKHAMAIPVNADTRDLYAPGGFSFMGGKRAPEWTRRGAGQWRRTQRRPRLRVAPRMAAAWQAFRTAGSYATIRGTGPIPIRNTGPISIRTTGPMRL